MKITISRSWLPWGRPSIEVDFLRERKFISIQGALKKEIITEIKGVIEPHQMQGRSFDVVIIDEGDKQSISTVK